MTLLNEALLRVIVGWNELLARRAEERGQTLAEYGLIMAVIAVAVIAAAVIAFRQAIIGAFNSATSCMDGTC